MGSLSLALTIFFGLLSIVLSVLLYVRGRRRKRLTFTYDLVGLQTRAHPEITILFKGRQIENLSRLRVVIWNSGNLEVRRSDIPVAGPPSIILPGVRILSVGVLEASAETKCTATGDGEQTLSVDFEFLNPGDYAVLDVLYESVESKSPAVDFDARVIGGLPSEISRFEQPVKRIQWVSPIGLALMWSVGAFYWVRAIPKWVHAVPAGISIAPNALWTSFLLIFFFFGCCATFQEYLRRYRRSRLPRTARNAFMQSVASGPHPKS
jgi:hypothetical protein